MKSEAYVKKQIRCSAREMEQLFDERKLMRLRLRNLGNVWDCQIRKYAHDNGMTKTIEYYGIEEATVKSLVGCRYKK